ncbi:MAG: acyl carrier protein [Gammaproteobacteria bacterium]|nr:acyl carrier protein [Gammaproteobacteria bacterium]
MSAASENIDQRIKNLVAKQLKIDIDTIKDESSFEDDLGADSLDRVELIMAIEDEFGIAIVDEDAEEITTVKDAISYVEGAIEDR